MEGADAVQPQVIAGPWFSRVLTMVFILTLVCLGIWVWLAGLEHPTASQKDLVDTVSHVFTACVGSILGLLGGKLT
jgi:hypothetical protein